MVNKGRGNVQRRGVGVGERKRGARGVWGCGGVYRTLRSNQPQLRVLPPNDVVGDSTASGSFSSPRTQTFVNLLHMRGFLSERHRPVSFVSSSCVSLVQFSMLMAFGLQTIRMAAHVW